MTVINSDVTFTRASSATYLDARGQRAQATTNELRINHNPVTLAREGALIEGQSTNLVFPSDVGATQTRAVVIGTVYTLSFHGAGSVTLSGAASGTVSGNGAFPAPLAVRSFVAATASLTLTVAGAVTEWQLEPGFVATSRIPTTSVAVTRAADISNITGAKLTELYSQAQGAMVFELTPTAAGVSSVIGSLNDGTQNNAIRITQKGSGTLGSIRAIASDGIVDVVAVSETAGNTLRANGVDLDAVSTQSNQRQYAAACAGVGKFLVCGDLENFRATADGGVTYTDVSFTGTFYGAYYGIGRFVIPSSVSTYNGAVVGKVAVSTDGMTFRRVNIPGLTQHLRGVTSNGTNLYVAVGDAGAVVTSPDAETWTVRDSGIASDLRAVAFGAGLYVAARANSLQNIVTSPDGINWTLRTTAVANANTNSVAFNGSLFVSVHANGGLQTSPDGINWTLRSSGTSNNLNAVVFADGLWVAVGLSGAVVTSADGITWTNRSATSGTSQTLNAVDFFNGKFYFAGAGPVIGENTAAGITGAATWVSKSTGLTTTLNGIAASGSQLLVCGTSGAIAISSDGSSFPSRTGNAATINGAAYGNGTYVIGGDAGLLATVDPTSFAYTRRTSGTTGDIANIKFLGGRFYACSGAAGVSRPCAFYSSDGITWTAINQTNRVTPSIAYGNSVYVACQSNGTLLTSADGITFTSATASGVTSQALNDIEFANGVFVCVGAAGVIMTSTNGTAWSLRSSGTSSTLRAVVWSTRDNVWYAVGDGGVMLRSSDGAAWESVANDVAVAIFTGAVLQANPVAGKLIPGQRNRVAITWASGGVSISVNGGAPVTDASVTMPAVTQLSIGMTGDQSRALNGAIRLAKSYRAAVTLNELQSLSRI